jgi:DNA/RNA-binding domain of Phe-tRNA-synthetase-like protein
MRERRVPEPTAAARIAPAHGIAPRDGHVAEELRAELPGLGIVSLALPAPHARRSPRGVRDHLDMLSTRLRGADALALRQRPVPHAYRVCFRHVGLDPDATRAPIEAAAIERLVQGGFVSRGLLDDALTIALVETGVPIWALDADAVQGDLRLRLARPGERLGDPAEGLPLPAGQIVAADSRVPLAPLFGEPAAAVLAGRRTTRLLLFAVAVAGVPRVHVEEALWQCADALGTAPDSNAPPPG